MSTVTVVIPCYRYGRFVRECVDSVLANHHVDLDILVIDDASPDDSWSIIRELPTVDPRIRVHRNPTNQGLISTANDGVLTAPGDYVVLLSADDALAPGWLDTAVAILDAHPEAGLAFSPPRRFVGDVPTVRQRRKPRLTVHEGNDWLRATCEFGVTTLFAPDVVVRTSIQRTVGGYDPSLPYSSDMEMWLRVGSLGPVAEVANIIGGLWRVSHDSMSRDIYTDLVVELKVRHDAFEAWHAFAKDLVPQRDEYLALARQRLASQAIWRAHIAYLQDPDDGQFDRLCAFALELDPVASPAGVARLKAWTNRRSVRLLQHLVPRNAWSRLRALVTDLRARGPFS